MTLHSIIVINQVTHTTDQISRVHSGALWGTLDCLWNTLSHSGTLWFYLECGAFSGVTLEIVPTLWSVVGADFSFSLSFCHVLSPHGLPIPATPCPSFLGLRRLPWLPMPGRLTPTPFSPHPCLEP